MNIDLSTYSLASESRRWWWPTAAAGTVAAGAITAILTIPAAAGPPAPVPAPGPGSSGLHGPAGGPSGQHPCFLVRPRWNVALDGPQPQCGTRGPSEWRGTVRPGLDDKP